MLNGYNYHLYKNKNKSNKDIEKELSKALNRMSLTSFVKNQTSVSKRVINLLSAGVVVAGTMLPMTTKVYASESSQTTLSYIIETASVDYTLTTAKGTRSKQGTATTLSPPSADTQGIFPTLAEYVSGMNCTGCGKHCPLTAPQCGIGGSQYEQAVTLYNSTVSSTQQQTDSTNESTSEEQTQSASTTESAASSAETLTSQDEKTDDNSTQDNKSAIVQQNTTDTATTFENFISGLFCSGCGKHCPLTSLKCSRGQTYLEQAKVEFETLQVQQTENTTELENEATTNNASSATTATTPIDMAMEYVPFGGMMVGGIYYTIEVFQKKKVSNETKINRNEGDGYEK